MTDAAMEWTRRCAYAALGGAPEPESAVLLEAFELWFATPFGSGALFFLREDQERRFGIGLVPQLVAVHEYTEKVVVFRGPVEATRGVLDRHPSPDFRGRLVLVIERLVAEEPRSRGAQP